MKGFRGTVFRRAALFLALAFATGTVFVGLRAVRLSRGYGEVFRELEAGIREAAARQLLTYHPTTYFRLGRGGSSLSADYNPFGPPERVLDFHMIQTWAWPDQIPGLIHEARGSLPTKPVVMAEGAYEAFGVYPGLPEISPELARRQAWESYLSGGFHTYGHAATCCRYSPAWTAALEAPAANQMAILKSVLTRARWWTLVPDRSMLQHSEACRPVAARSAERDLVVAYSSGACSMELRKGSIEGPARVTWIDPESGRRIDGGEFAPDLPLAPPQGMKDVVLVIRADKASEAAEQPGSTAFPLTVSENHRYFAGRDGQPFLWLGDTIWPLIAWSPEEARRYFKARKDQGFTVIQAVAIWHLDEQSSRNPHRNYRGDSPLLNDNPLAPNEKYFEHLDHLIRMAGENGLLVALLPAWGLYVTKDELINASNARSYGRWLGARYRATPNLVWVLGGDTSVWGYYRQQNSWKLIIKDAICHNGITDSLCTAVRGLAQRY